MTERGPDNEDSPETTVDPLPRADTEFASPVEFQEAWALDDGPEWKPPFWTPVRITAVAVGVAALAVVAAAGFIGYHLRTPVSVATPAPVTTTSVPPLTTTTTTNPPPPSPIRTTTPPPAPPETETVTISATPLEPVRPPAPFFSGAGDRAFLANLQGYGWTIYNPQMLIARGHEVCNLLQSGMSVAQVKSRMAEYAATEPTIPDPYTAADNVVYAALYAYEPCFTR